MGPLATANHQIRNAERQAVEQRLARLTEPHRLTDRMLGQLEELNLDGVRVVPDRYGAALSDLRRALEGGHSGLSPRVLDRLQPGARTADAIEAIFTIQETIAPTPGDDFPFDEVAVM